MAELGEVIVVELLLLNDFDPIHSVYANLFSFYLPVCVKSVLPKSVSDAS